MTSAIAPRRFRVLVVDDHDDSREMVESILSANDFDVVGAPDGETALASAKASRPDVVITDLTLPRFSGEELASRLRGTAGLEDVPLVAMSGRDVEASGREMFAKTLRKPLDPRALPDAIRQVVRGDGGSPAPRRERLPDSQYRLLVDNAPTMVWRAGLDAKCDWFNEPWLAFTGRTLEQELGDGWSEGVHPEDLERVVAHYWTSFQAQQPFEMEYRLRRHDGVYRWIVDRGAPFHDESGAFAGFIGSCIDVDERRRADEGKTRFLRAMAHEMRTPLTPMSAYLFELEQLAARGDVVPPELVKKLARQKDRLVRLVDDLSNAARLETGEALLLDREDVDVGEIVARVVAGEEEELARVAPSRPVPRFDVHRPAGKVVARVDRHHLTSAVGRVISNAVRFSPSGGTIDVELVGGEAVTLTVSDQGIGIPEAEIGRVGTPYFRASNAPLANFPGLGLGLATVKQIVISHGGALAIEGRAGGGTRVTLTLPRTP